ncbi:hypothetical protein HT031_002217 [Scenedesmus sp. PABB004]|nr:hypothetical protein HT031_002217 [Scenedesmus sp. PABB004]
MAEDPGLSKLLELARAATEKGQLERAITLLMGASRRAPLVPEVWWLLATALAGRDAGAACRCYLRTAQLLAAAPGPLEPGAANLAAAATDNAWLLAGQLLPPGWPAAAADGRLAAAWRRAARALVVAALHAAALAAGDAAVPHVQLVAVGGLGVQALQLAAAGSDVQAALAAAAAGAGVGLGPGGLPRLGLSFLPAEGGALSAHLASQLFLDNGVDDIIGLATWAELADAMAGQAAQAAAAAARVAAAAAAAGDAAGDGVAGDAAAPPPPPPPPPVLAALLAGCVQPSWAAAAGGCVAAARGLAAALAAGRGGAGGCRLSPARVRVWAAPVECADLVALNEVDLPALAAATRGGYAYGPANAALRRSARPAQVSRFAPRALAEPVALLELEPVALLRGALAAQERPGPPTPAGEAPQERLTAALLAGRGAHAGAPVVVAAAGRLDAVVWWLEFELGPGCVVSFAPAALRGRSSCSSSCSSSAGDSGGDGDDVPDVLQPHVWQHVQYLPLPPDAAPGELAQGAAVAAGQCLALRAVAEPDALSLSVWREDAAAAAAPGGGPGDDASTLQEAQREAGRSILPYHLSMLNDAARTRAYDAGIAGAVRALLTRRQSKQPQAGQQQQGEQQQQQQAEQQQQQQQGEQEQDERGSCVVLDVGCGTGLLSLMAATAAAAAGAPAALHIAACEREPALAGVARQLVSAHGLGAQVAVHEKLSGQLTLGGAAGDLPARAALVVHEIFGTDPLGEQVLPALRQVHAQLAAPGAAFLPRALRVVAAVAACPAAQRRLRLPARAEPWDLSSLALLQPRKLELQLDDLHGQLLLLTAPAPVVSFDFEAAQSLQLNGQATVQLAALPAPLPLRAWMAQSGAPDWRAAAPEQAGGAGAEPQPPPPGDGAAAAELCVVSWFEADCGDGGWLSTAPGATKYGHWQQSLEFVAPPPARSAGPGPEFHLTVTWAVDRLRFSVALQLQRLAAAPGSSGRHQRPPGAACGGATMAAITLHNGSNLLLHNGVIMPAVGLGTFRARGAECQSAVAAALRAGVRLIDTASVYRNETDVAAALAAARLPREEVFLTSKLGPAEHGAAAAAAAAAILERLQTSYLDLLLIHWPGAARVDAASPANAELRAQTWRALEALHAQGCVRAIGVSNYTERHLAELLRSAAVAPHVNQFEVHPRRPEAALRRACAAAGIAVTAYASLGAGQLLADPVVRRVAARAGRTEAQVLLRWGLQQGCAVIPKSVRPDRIEQASPAALTGWALSPADMDELDAMQDGHKFCWDAAGIA